MSGPKIVLKPHTDGLVSELTHIELGETLTISDHNGASIDITPIRIYNHERTKAKIKIEHNGNTQKEVIEINKKFSVGEMEGPSGKIEEIEFEYVGTEPADTDIDLTYGILVCYVCGALLFVALSELNPILGLVVALGYWFYVTELLF